MIQTVKGDVPKGEYKGDCNVKLKLMGKSKQLTDDNRFILELRHNRLISKGDTYFKAAFNFAFACLALISVDLTLIGLRLTKIFASVPNCWDVILIVVIGLLGVLSYIMVKQAKYHYILSWGQYKKADDLIIAIQGKKAYDECIKIFEATKPLKFSYRAMIRYLFLGPKQFQPSEDKKG